MLQFKNTRNSERAKTAVKCQLKNQTKKPRMKMNWLSMNGEIPKSNKRIYLSVNTANGVC